MAKVLTVVTVTTALVTSSSEALITLLVATMAEVPQMEVPAAMSWTNLGLNPRKRPRQWVKKKVLTRAVRIIKKPMGPTVKMSERLSRKPNKIMARFKTFFRENRMPGVHCLGISMLFVTRIPKTMARDVLLKILKPGLV